MEFFLNNMEPGFEGTIIIMVCRRWDVYNLHGRFMSTDFIVTDKQGNVMHCVARSASAHCFLGNLQEGNIYSLRKFVVQPRDQYRILRENQYVIQVDGSTVVHKATEDAAEFNRFPFQFTPFEELQPTGTTHFVDVVGFLTSVGKPNKTSTGGQTVEFNLNNERGRQVRITLWGYLGDELISKKAESPGVYAIILTSMTAKYYSGRVCLSSSSSTLIIDNPEIPALQTFKDSISNIDVHRETDPVLEKFVRKDTLRSLLEWARNPKNEPAVFRNKVEITGIENRSGWHFLWCGKASCKKGIDKQRGSFWCASCDSRVTYPKARFRLHLEVKDATDHVSVILFDETAEKLVHTTASALLDAHNSGNSSQESGLPPVLENLIGTSHMFELKSKTFYDHKEYESFNCSHVINVELEDADVSVDSDVDVECSKEDASSPSKKLKGVVPIVTPAKTNEGKKIRKFIGDLDVGTSVDGGSGGKGGLKKLRKKRYRCIDDSESGTDDTEEVNTKETGEHLE